MQRDREAAARRQRVRLLPAAEGVCDSARRQARDRAVGSEVAFPCACGTVVEVARIAGRGEIQRARGGDLVDRVTAAAFLERRLVVIRDIVDQNVTARGPEVEDVLREAGWAD